jgi:3-hydroxybutyryl-CoA dehydratase
MLALRCNSKSIVRRHVCTVATQQRRCSLTPSSSPVRKLHFLLQKEWISSSVPTHTIVRGTIPAGGKGVAVDQFAELERTFTPDDVDRFGRIIGDRNPLHQSWTLEEDELPADVRDLLETHPLVKRQDGEDSTKILVHGILVASLFSSIFGTLIPGSVYLSQMMDFRRPVYANESVVGRVTIKEIQSSRKGGIILTCNTQVLRQDKECVRGEAKVLLLHGVSDSDMHT